MYPLLLSTGSASRWYSKKQTQKEKVAEIEYMEEKIAESKQAELQVGTRILIRGIPAAPSRSGNLQEQEDERDSTAIEEDEELDNNAVEPGESGNTHPIFDESFDPSTYVRTEEAAEEDAAYERMFLRDNLPDEELNSDELRAGYDFNFTPSPTS